MNEQQLNKIKAPILIVDDEPAFLGIYQHSLEKYFEKIVTAPNGRKALDEFQQHMERGIQIPVVITDVMMPEMDGIELTMEIQKQAPGTQIMIISGKLTPTVTIYALKDNVRVFMKPMEPVYLALAARKSWSDYTRYQGLLQWKKQFDEAHVLMTKLFNDYPLSIR